MSRNRTRGWASDTELTDPVLAAGRGEIVPVRRPHDRRGPNGTLRLGVRLERPRYHRGRRRH